MPLRTPAGILTLTDAEEGHVGEPVDVIAAHVVSYRPAKHGTDILLVGGGFVPVRESMTTVRRALGKHYTTKVRP